MPTALVTGATGITGHAIVEELLKDPKWTHITTLSRSQKGRDHERISHATLDLQASAQEMSKQLSSVAAEYVFFCAYLARDDEAEAAKVNVAMLRNFVEALAMTSADKQLKRIVLVNGLKQYGVHLGRVKNPMHESDPWVEGNGWPPNFYYDQQRLLAEYVKRPNIKWDYVVTYAQDVIGVAHGNFMNLATSLGLYCAVSAAMPGQEIPYPGSKFAYLSYNTWTSAKLHAQFCHWAALQPKASNEGFNVVNGDVESWQNLWPKVVDRFGGKIPSRMFAEADQGKYKSFDDIETKLASHPPIDIQARGMGLDGEFKQNTVYQQIDTSKWAERPEVITAWKKIRDGHGLDQQAWDKATWPFLTFVTGRDYHCIASMSKARKLGWTGYLDTWDAFEETFNALVEEKVLPPLR